MERRAGRRAAFRVAGPDGFARRALPAFDTAVRGGGSRLCRTLADAVHVRRQPAGSGWVLWPVRRADCGVAGARGQGAGRRSVRARGGGRQPGQRVDEAVVPPAASGAVVRLSAAVHLQFSQRARVRVLLFFPVPGGDLIRDDWPPGAQSGDLDRGGGRHADHRAIARVSGGALSHRRAGGICGGIAWTTVIRVAHHMWCGARS